MNCLICGKEIELVDTTFSNITTNRCVKGEHTGDIYYCDDCQTHFLDNFLTGEIEYYNY